MTERCRKKKKIINTFRAKVCPALDFREDICRCVLLVLEDKLDVLVGKGHQVGADQGHDPVQDCRLDQVHVPNPPEKPWVRKRQ